MKSITEINDPRLVKALAHPLRVRILRVLEVRTASPNEISNEIGAPLANVSYHVRALERAGLIELKRTTPRRGAVEHYYRAIGRLRVTDDAWEQVPAIIKAGLVDSALGQVGELAASAAVNGGFERKESVLSRHSIRLDKQGFQAAARAASDFIDEIRAIASQSEERIAAKPAHTEEPIAACLAVMLFEAAESPAPS
jgi:DNA-binding transcriptional ArsR family regulator